MRKIAFGISKNKPEDQLIIPLFLLHRHYNTCTFEIQIKLHRHLLRLCSMIFTDLVGNPEDRFPHDETCMMCIVSGFFCLKSKDNLQILGEPFENQHREFTRRHYFKQL